MLLTEGIAPPDGRVLRDEPSSTVSQEQADRSQDSSASPPLWFWPLTPNQGDSRPPAGIYCVLAVEVRQLFFTCIVWLFNFSLSAAKQQL